MTLGRSLTDDAVLLGKCAASPEPGAQVAAAAVHQLGARYASAALDIGEVNAVGNYGWKPWQCNGSHETRTTSTGTERVLSKSQCSSRERRGVTSAMPCGAVTAAPSSAKTPGEWR